jgi:hypothetical protein
MTKLSFAKLALAAAVLAVPNTANAAPAPVPVNRAAADTGAVTSRSPAVSFKEVGKEVVPGIFQIDPARLHGRRLILTNSGTALVVCIGVYSEGTCYGIYIDIKNTN